MGCRPCGIDANIAEFILKATSLHHLDAQAKAARLQEWADAWRLEGEAFLRNWVGLLKTALCRIHRYLLLSGMRDSNPPHSSLSRPKVYFMILKFLKFVIHLCTAFACDACNANLRCLWTATGATLQALLLVAVLVCADRRNREEIFLNNEAAHFPPYLSPW